MSETLPPPARAVAPLRLLAQDAEDLQVISAALQDAVVRVGDVSWEPQARTLTLSLNRFCWECGEGGRRVRAGLQLGSVLRVRARDVPREVPEAVLELLAVEFYEREAPGGELMLHFAGGGDLRAEVECVDAALADLCDAWETPHTPRHRVEP